MPLTPSEERIPLTYQGATFRLSLNCLCVALVAFGAIWLPGPKLAETSGGPSLNVIGHSGGSTRTSRGLASVFIVKYEWQEVQACNPSVEVKSWSTSLDPIIRLFRKQD